MLIGPLHTIATSMQLSVIPHLTIYGDVKPDQLKKSMTQRTMLKFKELSGFRSSTSTDIVVPKLTPHEAKLMNIQNALVTKSLKAETTRKALHEAAGCVGLN